MTSAARAPDAVPLVGYQRPRIGTPRDHSLRTLGPAAAQLMALVGVELFPWQRLTVDIGMEVLPSGLWRSATVGLVVARQNGKTRGPLIARIMAQLYLFGGLTLHSAADRAVPRSHFEELAELVTGVPSLSREIKRLRLANGQEELTLKSGASYRILAPTERAFRGWTAHLIVWDELREQRDLKAWSAALYTQRMVANPQLWFASNAGDPESIILNRERDRGRAAAADPKSDPSMTYLEWSADPELRVDDPEAWRQANPSLGLGLREEAFREEMANDEPNRFRTEALCQWVAAAASLAVSADRWRLCAEGIPDRDLDSRPWLAVDIDPEQERAVLVAAGWHGGRLVAEIVQRWEGDISESVVAERTIEWFRSLRARAVAYDPYTTQGAADKISATLGERPVRKVTGVEWYTACRQLREAVQDLTLWHNADPVLSGDVLAAARRDVGDGSWTMSRRHSDQSIPAATALARAVHLAVTPEPVPRVH